MSVTSVAVEVQGAESAPEQEIQGRSQWQLTWRRLLSDKVAVISLIVIVIMVALAIAAPAFAALTGHPSDTAYPNTGESAAGLPVAPGTNGFLLGTDGSGRDLLVSGAGPGSGPARGLGRGGRPGRRARRRPGRGGRERQRNELQSGRRQTACANRPRA